ncbi:Integrase [Pasteurella testudinis DSM 23072]|uniref:Integrase n=1 Tax=Pasteurella testudinis DSM 23072 TaxID=1122938 RepID=A0A1W1V7M5_9PAST|nr:site-specific integrase [Pasteurella testudinis]SMB89286.1 Integrase [Pasteurella testudinis DSM 23072]SUB51651.1 prophage integrase [Pasteurella testudinis]
MKFKEISDMWLDFHSEKVKLHTSKYVNSLILKYLSSLNDTDCDNIKPSLIFDIIKDIESRYAAKRTLGIVVSIFDYAGAMGYVEYNPAARLTNFIPPHTIRNHPTILNPQELIRLLKAMEKYKYGSASVKNALKMIIYTAQRRSEIIGAQWSEIDLYNRVWTIPAHRMKMGIEQRIPITEPMVNLLYEQKKYSHNEYIFSSVNKNNRCGHVHKSSPSILIYSLGYKGKQTIHGFRTTFSSLANDAGSWNPDAIELQLAHKIRGVRGVYNKSDYFSERVRMMAWWNNQIDFWISL